MKFIFPKNKENFESVAESTFEKFSAVIWEKKPSPEGLRQKSLPCLSKHLPVEWLQAARFFARCNDFYLQRKPLEYNISTLGDNHA